MPLQIHKVLWLEQKRVVEFYGTINIGAEFQTSWNFERNKILQLLS